MKKYFERLLGKRRGIIPGSISVPTVLNRTIDAAVAIALVAAMVVIYRLDQRIDVVTQVTPKPQTVSKPLTMAVTTPPEFDDMGKLLISLGKGYDTFDTISVENLDDVTRLKKYDVLFLTCRTNMPKLLPKLKLALRDYVSSGGTLYASDLWYPLIADTFIEFAVPNWPVSGKKQEVTAEVVDPGLRDVLGSELQLKFELDYWMPAAFAGDTLTTIVRGRYTSTKDESLEAPLLVKFPLKKGIVIFTSFHNASQNDESERKLLRYLVFMAATAGEDAKITETIASGGFSPKKQNILTASSDNPSVTQTYQSTKGGRLKFALGFANRGARLRLTIKGPDGRTVVEKEGPETFFHEIVNAPIGEWICTVTALEVPYANFPFQLTIAE